MVPPRARSLHLACIVGHEGPIAEAEVVINNRAIGRWIDFAVAVPEDWEVLAAASGAIYSLVV